MAVIKKPIQPDPTWELSEYMLGGLTYNFQLSYLGQDKNKKKTYELEINSYDVANKKRSAFSIVIKEAGMADLRDLLIEKVGTKKNDKS